MVSDDIASVVDKEYLALPARRLPPDVTLTHHSSSRTTTQHQTTRDASCLLAVPSHSVPERLRLMGTSTEQLAVGIDRCTDDNVKSTSSSFYHLNVGDDLLTKYPRTASGLSDVSRYFQPRHSRLVTAFNNTDMTDGYATVNSAADKVDVINNRHPYTVAVRHRYLPVNKRHGTAHVVRQLMTVTSPETVVSSATHTRQISDDQSACEPLGLLRSTTTTPNKIRDVTKNKVRFSDQVQPPSDS